MRELHIQKVLPPDTIHYLFGNLNALVDFQRRFLIQLEEMAEKDAEEQRFGALFVQNEEAFSVYEPYCSNYYSAQDLVVQETPKLQKLEHILNPTYQLPSMLIKPIQRICKYPLLQGELIKSTNKDWPHVAEMEDGLNAIKRVTEKVNETQRQHENIQAVEDLKKRVDDWKVRKKKDDNNFSSCIRLTGKFFFRESTWMDMVVYYFKKR
jgi:cell division control protein 24